MTYSQITPTHDWFFRHENPQPDAPPILHAVAAWALKVPNDEGHSEVVGLIAPIFPGNAAHKLHEPPPVKGYYIHRDQLNPVELEQLTKR